MASRSPSSLTRLPGSVPSKKTSGRVENKHCGAVQVRGMIRRVWRPRYLEIDEEGVLRYYEAAAPDPNAAAPKGPKKKRDIRNEMQAFSLPDLKSLDRESTKEEVLLEEKVKQHTKAKNEMNASSDIDTRSIYYDDAVHVDRNHGDDHVLVEPPSPKATKSLSKDFTDASSKVESWDDIHMASSAPSSTTSVNEKTASDKNIEVMLTAESAMDTVILQRKKSDSNPPSSEDDTFDLTNVPQKETLHHQIHDHRPKAVMTILSARMIDIKSLRDVHVGLPKGSYGFVFCGRQIFSEQSAYGHGFGQTDGFDYGGTSMPYAGESGGITGDHFEIRDDICHPLAILSANEQYFDTSRDYLCSVGTKKEAKRWVQALRWAATMATNKTVGDGSSHSEIGGLHESLDSVGATEISGGKRKDILIRGSFEDPTRSPLSSPTRSARGIANDFLFEEESSDHKDTASSLLDNSRASASSQNSADGYTLVTKVRNFDIQNLSRKRLLGCENCIMYEIRLLLLSADHMIHRSRRKQKGEIDTDLHCWDIEQRTIFRTFDEIVQVLESMNKHKRSGKKSGLDKILRSMKDSRHTKIISMSNMNSELSKSVDNVDNVLREITSDPALCDTTTVKQFLGLLGSSKWRGGRTSGTKREKLRISDGDSIDDFVKKWLAAHAEGMKLTRLIQCYLMLLLNNAIFETLLSILIIFGGRHFLVSCWANPITVTLRIDSLLALLSLSFYVGYNSGSSKPVPPNENKVRHVVMRKRTKSRSIKKVKRSISSLVDDTSKDDAVFDTGSFSDDESQVLSSPLPIFSENNIQSCWSRPDDKLFVVRSRTYLRNKIKLPSAPSPFKCRGTDMWLTDNPERNISRLPCVLGGKLGEENTLVVNFLLPFGNFVAYFSIPEKMPENTSNIWNKFKNGDQKYRDDRLKLLPVVIDGPWIVKKAVGPGTAPALLSQSIPLQYYFTHETDKKKGIYEIDVIITASRIAKGILNVVKSHTNRLTIALGFIIEATTEAELPEVVLGSCQLHSLNLDLCPHLPKYFLDERSLEGSFEEDSS